MNRRTFTLGATAAVLPISNAGAVALPVPSSDDLHFRILRNGSPIGDHHVVFSQSGDDLTVTVTADGLVTVAMIPVFSYSVRATECWSNGVFQSLESTVNYNGTPLQVHAHKSAGGYQVQGTKVPPYMAPPDTIPLTYWNKAMMNGTILNIQTAHSYRVKVASPGWNKLPTATGGTLVAQRFNLSGKLNISVWYDQNNAWSGLEFQRLGDITYEKYVA